MKYSELLGHLEKMPIREIKKARELFGQICPEHNAAYDLTFALAILDKKPRAGYQVECLNMILQLNKNTPDSTTNTVKGNSNMTYTSPVTSVL